MRYSCTGPLPELRNVSHWYMLAAQRLLKRWLSMQRISNAFFFCIAGMAMLFQVSTASAQIPLNTAQNFGVLGGSAVTNTGPSVVTGDVGVSPGVSVTGFPPGTVVGGTIHAGNATAAQAQSDL